jgi:hypothetical protein
LSKLSEIGVGASVATDNQVKELKKAVYDGVAAIPSNQQTSSRTAEAQAAASSSELGSNLQGTKKLIIHCNLGLNRTPLGAYVYMAEHLGVEPNAAEKMINNALADRREAAGVEKGKYHLDMYDKYDIKNRCVRLAAVIQPRSDVTNLASPASASDRSPSATASKTAAAPMRVDVDAPPMPAPKEPLLKKTSTSPSVASLPKQ